MCGYVSDAGPHSAASNSTGSLGSVEYRRLPLGYQALRDASCSTYLRYGCALGGIAAYATPAARTRHKPSEKPLDQ